MVTQHSGLALRHHLHRTDQGRHGEAGIGDHHQIDRPGSTDRAVSFFSRRRLTCPHRVGHTDGGKTLDPEAICLITARHNLFHRNCRHQADTIRIHSQIHRDSLEVTGRMFPLRVSRLPNRIGGHLMIHYVARRSKPSPPWSGRQHPHAGSQIEDERVLGDSVASGETIRPHRHAPPL